jgi:hypothetical protein
MPKTHEVLEQESQSRFKLRDYLGDGVYALFDGYGIWLHANDHLMPTDRIYLEPEVFDALKRFSDRCKSLADSQGRAAKDAGEPVGEEG